MTKEFSVWAFLPGGENYAIERFVDLPTAARQFKWAIDAVSKKVVRLIITDGGDCIVYEWTRGRGVTYPPKQ